MRRRALGVGVLFRDSSEAFCDDFEIVVGGGSAVHQKVIARMNLLGLGIDGIC